MAEINLDEIYEEWKARYPGEKISPNNDMLMHLELGLAKKFEMDNGQIQLMLDVVTPENCQIRSLDLMRVALLLNLDMEAVEELRNMKDAPFEILRRIQYEIRKEAMAYMQKQLESIKKEQIPKAELEKLREKLTKQYQQASEEMRQRMEELEKELAEERASCQQEPVKKGFWGRRNHRKKMKELAEIFKDQKFDDMQASEIISAFEMGISIEDVRMIAQPDIPAGRMRMLRMLVKQQ